MTLWLDAQLSPRLAPWIAETFGGECLHVRDLGLRDAEDVEIFQKARDAGSVVMNKDEVFVRLVERNSPSAAGYLGDCGQHVERSLQSTSIEDFSSRNVTDHPRR